MKSNLIEQINRLLNPQPENIEVFRHIGNDRYTWGNKTVTRKQAESIPARMRIYVIRKDKKLMNL